MSTTLDRPAPRSAWLLSAGRAGHEIQVRGVAAKLAADAKLIRLDPHARWAWAAPWGPAAAHPEIAPPWPDLVLASGRPTIPYARAIRRLARGESFVVVLQDPVVPARWFDLVWTNEHDRLRGPNVVTTLTSPHALDRAAIAAGAGRLTERLAPLRLPRPWIGLLVGGLSRAYQMTPQEVAGLAAAAVAMAREAGGSLIVTPSRRTGADNIAALAAGLGGTPHWLWDGAEGENPYAGILGAADHLVVTCDSVNMLGEAAFTGKPIQVWPLPGGASKFRFFHEAMAARGIARRFDGRLLPAAYAPVDATVTIAAAIRDRYAAFRERG